LSLYPKTLGGDSTKTVHVPITADALQHPAHIHLERGSEVLMGTRPPAVRPRKTEKNGSMSLPAQTLCDYARPLNDSAD
jgi:hypothetical protein